MELVKGIPITAYRDEARAVAHKRSTASGLLPKALEGGHDWIVMRALEKDRTRRYATAPAFAADIERHLEDRPLEARPEHALPAPEFRPAQPDGSARPPTGRGASGSRSDRSEYGDVCPYGLGPDSGPAVSDRLRCVLRPRGDEETLHVLEHDVEARHEDQDDRSGEDDAEAERDRHGDQVLRLE